MKTSNQAECSKESVNKAQRQTTKAALLLLSFFIIIHFSFAQTSALSFSQIPLSSPELNSSGRGAIYWNGIFWDNASAPQVPSGTSTGRNGYIRFNWYEMETAQGVYNFTGGYPSLEFWLRYIMDRGEAVGLGVMTVCDGCDAPLDGGRAAYPAYLHTLMQEEAAGSRDWKASTGTWVPNWNSNNYLTRFEALLDTLSKFLNTKSYNGRPYRDVIDYIDIRGYGNYGEWHNAPYWNETPSGRVATSASLKRIIDAHITSFPNYPLTLLCGAFDAANASEIPKDVTYYALNASNNYGKFGWRRDNLGEHGTDAILANNPYSYNGSRFDTAILNRWKYAAVTGEPILGGGQYADAGPSYYDLRREINLYHIAHFGNGNYPGGEPSGAAFQDTIRNAFKLTGYRYYLTGGSVTSTLVQGQSFTVSVNWRNAGVAPLYEKRWKVYYELRNGSNVTVWSGISGFRPYLFLPGDSVVTDQFVLPGSVPAGSYSLKLVIRDSTGFRPPIQIAITGRAADGSYLLKTLNVAVAAPNQLPNANAGTDQSVVIPNVTLNGSASSDPDGSITAYRWRKLSGPSTYTFVDSTVTLPVVNNLLLGTYAFELRVTDNAGATDLDTVIVTSAATILPEYFEHAAITETNSHPELTWTMKTIATGTRFVVEYSTDGKYYQTAGEIASREGQLRYQFTDIDRTVQSTQYYRIAVVLQDQLLVYSAILHYQPVSDHLGKLQISPNPFSGVTWIRLSGSEAGEYQYAVYSTDGRCIRTAGFTKTASNNSLMIDLNQFPAGTYWIRVQKKDGGFQVSQQLIQIK